MLDLDFMMRWAGVFLAAALVAAFLGFAGVFAFAVGVAKFLFFLFMAVCSILLLLGMFAGHRPGS